MLRKNTTAPGLVGTTWGVPAGAQRHAARQATPLLAVPALVAPQDLTVLPETQDFLCLSSAALSWLRSRTQGVVGWGQELYRDHSAAMPQGTL